MRDIVDIGCTDDADLGEAGECARNYLGPRIGRLRRRGLLPEQSGPIAIKSSQGDVPARMLEVNRSHDVFRSVPASSANVKFGN